MAEPVILYGNPVAAVKAWLDARLGGVKAFADVPKTRPESFVILTPSGGSDLSPVHDRALMMVDSWGPTAAKAQDLAQLVRAHLGSLRNDRVRGVLIYTAKPLGGLVYVPDPDAAVPRYRQNWEFVTRGEQIQ